VKKPASATDPLWYKDAIIYELHVRAFADSNGDGIGDFPGLLSRLDYLQNLGVTCIWLLPFFPSPLRDDGYDIANYFDVKRGKPQRPDTVLNKHTLQRAEVHTCSNGPMLPRAHSSSTLTHEPWRRDAVQSCSTTLTSELMMCIPPQL
jgi:hypothetical protein